MTSVSNRQQQAAPQTRGAAVVSESEAMSRAVRLAARSFVSARPNPPVGCVVLSKMGHAVGEGRHLRPGQPHAEPVALAQAGADAKGGTLVVTLEPCNHFGRTPPCTQRILESGIARVVYASSDRNPEAEGGSDFLRRNGVEVAHAPHPHATRLNAPHLTRSSKGRPHVIAKWAQCADGNMCPPAGKNPWISSVKSRREVHRLRGRVDAVLTGIGTVLADDCRLDPRDYPRRQTPLVAVASRKHPVPPQAKILSNQNLLTLQEAHPRDQLKTLGQQGVSVVLLEAGPTLLHAYWTSRLIDEAWIFLAPEPLPGAHGQSPVPNPQQKLDEESKRSTVHFGPDRLIRLYPESS